MKQVCILVFLSSIMTGCMSIEASLFPIEGPLTAISPLPVVNAVAKGVETNSGDISLTLPNGEKCKGKWSSIAPQTANVSYGSLFTGYGGAAFGTRVEQGIVPGVNKGQAFMTCDKGSTVESEFYTGSGTASGTGISKDSSGNVYKMIF